MKALVWHGKEDIRCDVVTDPEIEEPRDAIIKVTSCAICGSDLHLFHNFIPAMLPGDIMGHEMMGEVVEVGTGVNGRLKKGDRVITKAEVLLDRKHFSPGQIDTRTGKTSGKHSWLSSRRRN
jgi:threonine dehydrogenase-like Zn-dependent dehydrogenase